MLIFINGIETEEINPHEGFHILFDLKDEKYIGLSVAEQLDILFLLLTRNDIKKGTVCLKLYRSNLHIDLCVFGVLILIVLTHKEINLIFEFDYAVQTEDSSDKKDIESVVWQYLNLSTLADVSIAKRISLIHIDSLGNPKQISIDNKRWKHTSSRFLPIIHIKNDNYNTLFSPSKFWEFKCSFIDETTHLFKNLNPGTKKENINLKMYSFVRDHLFAVTKNFQIEHYILESYLKLLTDFRFFTLIFEDPKILDKEILLSHHLKANREIPFHTEIKTKVKFKRNRDYFALLENTHQKLKTKSAIFIGIFSSIARLYAESIIDSVRVKPDFIFQLDQCLQKIFQITDQLVTGLQELFINVLEHSSSQRGILLCRIFDLHETEEFKKELPNFEDYVSQFRDDIETGIFLKKYFLDVNLLDVSNKGIIEKYQEKIRGDFSLADIYTQTPQTPLHSLARTEEKIGLIIYNNKIKNLQGYFYVSTPDRENIVQYSSANKKSISVSNVTFKSGSHYNVLLPLYRMPVYSEIKVNINFQGHYQPPAGALQWKYSNIWEYHVIEENDFNPNETKKGLVIINLDEFEKYDLYNKHFLERKGAEKIKSITECKWEELIPVFDFEKSNYQIRTNASFLKRFISAIDDTQPASSVSPVKGIIISGIKFETFQELVKLFFTPINSGNGPKRIYLFYIIHNSYYVPIVLAGTNYAEFYAINKNILRIRIEIPDFKELNSSISDMAPDLLKRLGNSLLFYSNPVSLKEFDVLLRKNGETYFEIFARKCLETDIDYEKTNHENTPNVIDSRFQGYKISKGHFRLGSKIHISDFYYAKRMFEINEFASKFALLTVNYLLHNENFDLRNKIEEGITIIGYEKYSDLLVINIKRLLQQTFNLTDTSTNINHNIIQDVENLTLTYKNNKIRKNVLFIVPISSTYSTSFKMENYLKEKQYYFDNIELPAINIINVADNSACRIDQNTDSRYFLKTDTVYNFGWRYANYKEKTTIIELEQGEIKRKIQKYFIQVYTRWYFRENCDLCFGGKNGTIKELPLIETDRASVTPQLIFGPGLKFSDKSFKEGIILPECSHHYGHYVIDKKHNVHFIDTRELLKDTDIEKNIIHWLNSLKKHKWYKRINSNVTLITPDGVFNSDFVYLVNKILFNSRANIIKYNPLTDYIANFQKFYRDTISNTSYLIYVDDQISTGATFMAISNYIKSCLPDDSGSKKFSAILTLISRSDDSTIEQLKENYFSKDVIGENNINWFKYLRLPTVVSSHLPCPICTSQTYYYDLADETALDPTKTYLLKKARKLNYITSLDIQDKVFHSYDKRIDESVLFQNAELSHKKNDFFSKPYEKTHELKLAIENFLYKSDLLAIDKVDQITDLEIIAKQFRKSLDRNLNIQKKYSQEDILLMLLKVLSFSPFVNYYSIRKSVFEKINSLLDHKFQDIKKGKELTTSRLRVIKLLLKRISYLKGNYLIRKNNIEKLLAFYQSHQEIRDKEKAGRNTDSLILKHIQNLISLLKIITNREEWIKKLKNPDSLKYQLNKEIQSEEYLWVRNQIKLILYNEKNNSVKDFPFFIYPESIINVIYRFHTRILRILDDATFVEVPLNIESHSETMKAIAYTARSLQNLDYRLRTWSDFHYFIAHLIKEIVHNNESKAIHLDSVITSEYNRLRNKQISKNPDTELPIAFRQLLRILKLENIGILNNLAIEFERKLEFTSPTSDATEAERLQLVKTKLKSAEQDPSLVPLLTFLTNERKGCNEKSSAFSKYCSDSFARFIILKHFLESDNEGLSIIKDNTLDSRNLSDNIDFILKQLKIMLLKGEEDFSVNAEAYLFIRYTPIHNKGIMANDVFFIPREGTLAGGIDLSKSFILPVMNGLALREHGGKQNIFEFKKDKMNKWKSLKNYYVNEDGAPFQDDPEDDGKLRLLEKLEESVKFRYQFNHLLFYRISNLKYSREYDDRKIHNNGQAVLLIASKRASFLKAEKLRYLTLIKDALSAFIKHHYLNDSFREYLTEKQKNYEWSSYSHGFSQANKVMQSLINDYLNDDSKRYNIYLTNLIQTQFTRIKELEEQKDEKDFTREFSKQELLEEVKKIGEFIFEEFQHEDNLSILIFPKPSILFTSDFTFSFNADLLKIVLVEIIFNFKKNIQSVNLNNLYFEIDVEQDTYGALLTIKNNYVYDEIQVLEQKIGEKYKLIDASIPHGTTMIKNIYRNIFNTELYEASPCNDESKCYINKLPIFNFKLVNV